MNKQLAWAVLIVAAVVIFTTGGCAMFAKSPVGQAIQVADYEKALIVAAARQIKTMCNATPSQLAPNTCASAPVLYGKWRAGQITLANAIAAWKAVSTAGAASPELSQADAKVRAALDELEPLAKAALDLYRQFVDMKKIEQQITPAVAPAPASWLPVSPWLALEGAR